MDYNDHTTNNLKGKHLTYGERVKIEIWLEEGHNPSWIAKKLGRAKGTIYAAVKNGMTEQIRQGKKEMVYFADRSQAVYEENRKNSVKPFKLLESWEFVQTVCKIMKEKNWSVDAAVGSLKKNGKFADKSTVCTKTMYNYIDQNMVSITNLDLPQKLTRNTKQKRVRENKKRLGKSIELRPKSVESREFFGDWEIDTIRGPRGEKGSVILSMAERKTREVILNKLPDGSADSVFQALKDLLKEYGDKFSEVFRTITADNGSEFARLHEIEELNATQVYFTHPFSSYERGTNERHNGLIRRFIPKGRSIDEFSDEQIKWIEDWCNTLPRKLLNYSSPEELFEAELDEIYADPTFKADNFIGIAEATKVG